MNDYYELRVDMQPCSIDMTDLMAAILADYEYESFVPDDKGLTAYIQANEYSAESVNVALAEFPFSCRMTVKATLIEGRDWNAEWERNYFKPIVVDDKCAIHSSFHTDIPQCEYDIVIDPKMAFGTGHHATTSLIIAKLLEIDIDGKSVIDMGTGTGILAILAAMRGATEVTAIEIDGFAFENAVENIALNHHSEIKLINGDASALADVIPADIFIANINRNVITTDIAAYSERLKSGGTMLLSGFYERDIPIVAEAAAEHGLSVVSHTVKGDDHWTCLMLHKH